MYGFGVVYDGVLFVIFGEVECDIGVGYDVFFV